MRELGLTITCAIDDDHAALLSAAYRTQVNYEIYFFANEHHKRQFDTQPLRYCGIVTDPISHERFYPGEKSPRLLHDNQNYFFTADSNLALFRAAPSKYSTPQYRMEPDMSGESTEEVM